MWQDKPDLALVLEEHTSGQALKHTHCSGKFLSPQPTHALCGQMQLLCAYKELLKFGVQVVNKWERMGATEEQGELTSLAIMFFWAP